MPTYKTFKTTDCNISCKYFPNHFIEVRFYIHEISTKDELTICQEFPNETDEHIDFGIKLDFKNYTTYATMIMKLRLNDPKMPLLQVEIKSKATDLEGNALNKRMQSTYNVASNKEVTLHQPLISASNWNKLNSDSLCFYTTIKVLNKSNIEKTFGFRKFYYMTY
ncbi:hypothetical protein CDAR_42681 [Caerostris darwini]|uniref:Uncharacterized protein n=1 Tax=Caerostris darwini TaxID=1538125 RepID=A0AAV4WEV4_9ARAC|nr:hypothetical protein CDAR_42681 [Caerostris darwini]